MRKSETFLESLKYILLGILFIYLGIGALAVIADIIIRVFTNNTLKDFIF